MSTTIDSKVVQMKFDNAQFEKNVSQSMSSIDKLKSSLNFDKVADSFSNISRSARNINFSDTIESVEETGKKFNWLQEIASGALRSIGARIENYVTDKVVKLGKSLLGIDGIVSGYDKYTKLTESVQIMTAATGKSVEEIEDYVGTLNWFSDETSYKLTDMTDALSKFVNAGVDLDTAVPSIQGIATWAATCGVNVRDASRAFYNLSQAVGIGYLGTLDAKSLQNLNMLGPEFNEIAISAGLAHGQLKKVGDLIYTMDGKTEVNTRNLSTTLGTKWLTTDVLMSSLNEYGKYAIGLQEFMDQAEEAGKGYDTARAAMVDYDAELSKLGKTEEFALARKAFLLSQESKTLADAVGATQEAASTVWMNIIHTVLGDLNESKKLWGAVCDELYEVFVTPLNRLEEIVSAWYDLGGRDALISGLSDTYFALKNILTSITDAFKEIFGEIDTNHLGEIIYNITDNFRNFAKTLRENAIIANIVKTIALIFFTILRSVVPVIKLIGTVAKKAFDIVSKYFLIILNAISSVVKKVNEFINIFNKAAFKSDFFARIKDSFISAFTAISSVVMSFVNLFRIGIKAFIKSSGLFKENTDSTKDTIHSFADVLSWIAEKIEFVFNKITEVVNNEKFRFALSWWLNNAVQVFVYLGQIVKSVADRDFEAFKRALKGLWTTLKKITGIEFLDNWLSQFSVFVTIKGWAKSAAEGVANFFSNFKTHWENFLHFFKIDVAVDRVKAYFGIFSEKPNTDGVDDINGKLNETETIVDRIKGIFEKVKEFFVMLWGYIVEGAKWVWSCIKQLGTLLDEATGGMFSGIAGYFRQMFDELRAGDMSKLVGTARAFLATGLLAEIIKFIKNMRENNPMNIFGATKNFIDSLTGIGTKVGDAIKAIGNSISKTFKSMSTSIQASALKKIAVAILMLVAALWALSYLPDEKLKSGLSAISVIMIELATVMAIFTKSTTKAVSTMGDAAALNKLTTAFVKMAMAVLIIGLTMMMLGSLNPDNLKQGIMAVSVVMGLMTVLFKSASKSNKHFYATADILDKLGKSLIKIALFILVMGLMGKDAFKQGMTAFVVIVGLIAAFIKILGTSTNENFEKVGVSINKLCAGILKISFAIALLSLLNPIKMMLSVVAIGALLGFFVLFTKFIDAKDRFESLCNSLTKVSKAMLILALSVVLLAILPIEKMLAATLCLGVIMAALWALTTFTGNTLGFIESAGALSKLGTALLKIAIAIVIIGQLDADKIFAASMSIIAIIAALSIMIFALSAVGMNGKSVSKAIKGIASAILMVSIAMLVLGNMSEGQLMTGAMALLVIVGALSILSIMAPGILTLSIAVSKLGTAIALVVTSIGLLVVLLGLGLQMIVPILSQAGFLRNSLIEGAKIIGEALITLISNTLEGLANGIIAFLNVILTKGPEIFNKILEIAIEFLKSLKNNIKDIIRDVIEIVLNALLGILEAISDMAPQFLKIIGDIVMKVLNWLKDILPDLVFWLFDFIIEFIEKTADYINSHAERMARAFTKLFDSLMYLLAQTIDTFISESEFVSSFMQMGEDMVDGLIQGIKNMMPFLTPVIDAIDSAIQSVFDNFYGDGRSKEDVDKFYAALESNPFENKYSKEEIQMAQAIYNGTKTLGDLTEAEKEIYKEIDADIFTYNKNGIIQAARRTTMIGDKTMAETRAEMNKYLTSVYGKEDLSTDWHNTSAYIPQFVRDKLAADEKKEKEENARKNGYIPSDARKQMASTAKDAYDSKMNNNPLYAAAASILNNNMYNKNNSLLAPGGLVVDTNKVNIAGAAADKSNISNTTTDMSSSVNAGNNNTVNNGPVFNIDMTEGNGLNMDDIMNKINDSINIKFDEHDDETVQKTFGLNLAAGVSG